VGSFLLEPMQKTSRGNREGRPESLMGWVCHSSFYPITSQSPHLQICWHMNLRIKFSTHELWETHSNHNSILWDNSHRKVNSMLDSFQNN
jgi:hypothetical protein